MSTIVDGTKGALEMFTLVGHCKPTSFYIYHTSQQNNGGPSNGWQLKNVIALPPRCLYYTVGAAEGFLFLRGVREARWGDNGVFPVDDIDFFSLDVKTSELKKVCSCRETIFNHPNRARPLFGFPPSLSKPTL